MNKKEFFKIFSLVILLVLVLQLESFCENTSMDQTSVVQSNVIRDDALLDAIENNDLVKVKELIDNGANVDVKDDDGYTPLCYAIFVPNARYCKIIVRQWGRC